MSLELRYTVTWGTDARTLYYSDSHGRLLLVFDFNLSGGPKSLFLERTCTDDNNKRVARTPSNCARLEFAVECAKQFLASCGFTVEVVD